MQIFFSFAFETMWSITIFRFSATRKGNLFFVPQTQWIQIFTKGIIIIVLVVEETPRLKSGVRVVWQMLSRDEHPPDEVGSWLKLAVESLPDPILTRADNLMTEVSVSWKI